MFEITYNDYDALDYYVNERMAYENAEYDFTFENRYLVYHAPLLGYCIYFVLDMKTGLSSEALRVKKPLKFLNHRDFLPHLSNAIKYTGDRRFVNPFVEDPLMTIDSIFRVALPNYGYKIREEQIELCKSMFKGLMGYKVSLCEAEVGTGKSLAYLIAAVVARRCSGIREPVTIATATIELQKALVEKEIPRLSKILMDYRLIDKPLTATVRKGKEHYFCLFRYNDYLDKIKKYPDKYGKVLSFFERTNFKDKAFDLDNAKIPGWLKGKVCVKGSCTGCVYAGECKYSHYIKEASNYRDLTFQVTNHNLFLASERFGLPENLGLLRKSRFVVIDEAHKLKDAAKDIWGERLCEDTVSIYTNTVRHMCRREETLSEYKNLLSEAEELNRKLFELLVVVSCVEDREDNRGSIFSISPQMTSLITRLLNTIKEIEKLRIRVSGALGLNAKKIEKALKVFLQPAHIITWCEEDNGKLALCCCPKNISMVMKHNIWCDPANYVLTSGTMSDGEDFTYFEKEHGIALIDRQNIIRTSFVSPFDFESNTRLYIPKDMPIPGSNNDESYIKAISERIVQLIHATNGHTAILFTSYKALNAVYDMTKERLTDYDVIRMTRSNKTAIEDFKKSTNAVLFASGSMWEGVDCAGDALSSVIIVRLPFPIRSATMEEKKSASANVREFIDEYAVPEMLTKLRQGVGRLIRTETDTGVVSILDGRASYGVYSDRIGKALSKYPRVDSIKEIESFFKEIKPSEYFMK